MALKAAHSIRSSPTPILRRCTLAAGRRDDGGGCRLRPASAVSSLLLTPTLSPAHSAPPGFAGIPGESDGGSSAGDGIGVGEGEGRVAGPAGESRAVPAVPGACKYVYKFKSTS